MISFEAKGLNQLQQKLDGISSRVKDLTPVMREVSAFMAREAVQTFRKQADPVTGAPWKPTSELTLSTRPGSGGGKTLMDTGKLLSSLTAGVRYNSKSARIGTNLKYASVINTGKPSVIKPTRAKNLAIPVTRQAAKAKSARSWVQSAGDKVKWLFGKNGVWGIGKQDGRNGKITVHFILKKSIKAVQRRFLGVSPAFVTNVVKIIERGIVNGSSR